MKKILQLLGSFTIAASSSSLAVSCGEPKMGFATLPEVSNIFVGDNGKQVKYKIWDSYASTNYFLLMSEYEVYIKKDSKETKLTDDYIIKNGDVIHIKVLDTEFRRFADTEFQIFDTRADLSKLKLSFDEEIRYTDLKRMISDKIYDLNPRFFSESDFIVLVDGENSDRFNYMSGYIVDGAVIEVKASEDSRALTGSYKTTYTIKKLDISNINIKIKAFLDIERVRIAIKNELPNYYGNVSIIVYRGNDQVVFDSKYVSKPGDEFLIEAISGNTLYENKVKTTVMPGDLSEFKLSPTIMAGTKKQDVKAELLKSLNEQLKKADVDLILNDSDINIDLTNAPDYIKKTQALNKLIVKNENIETLELDVNITSFDDYNAFNIKIGSYKEVLDAANVQLKNEVPFLDIYKDFDVFREVSKNNQLVLEPLLPTDTLELADTLQLLGKRNSDYVDEGKALYLIAILDY
ncbi:hypothetical protein SCHIN_v1c11540 [Spiroplasma chinense]|uniref:Lipoprotein n=1 Tax=Spiroplasma chinense TaxID=216932 RepID=A0A5B9Y7P6_9MOLU|nr:lipoprotein [Spiroplasma chinense]QEH62347.1 hypothetical protein SCHIN_v1c11540 [Spiroplasma chinense]